MATGRPELLAAAPPLPPEIWNLAVVLTVSVLLGWMARLLRLMLTAADLRFAVEVQAVLHLKGLGASLRVLQSASMWHFHQLLRTTTEPTATKMARIQIPFDVVSSSVEIKRVGGAAGDSTVLAFKVCSHEPCTVQVYWGVQAESLDQLASASGFVSRTSTTGGGLSVASPRHLIPPVLRQLSVDGTMRALRTAPSRLGSRIRRQRRRHELRDDATADISPDAQASGEDRETAPPSTVPNFTAHSDIFKYDSFQAESDIFNVPIPPAAATCPAEEEVQSLIAEVDRNSPSVSALRLSPALPPVSTTPRFSAVIVVRASAVSHESAKGSLFGKFNARQPVTNATTVVCHCVALDFLPTPLKPERFTPAIVKKTSYTKTAAYASQDIYGRDTAASSECAICLEGAVSVVLLPCRHFCVCRVCLQEIDRCPICRATFATYVGYDGMDGPNDGDVPSMEVKMGSDGD